MCIQPAFSTSTKSFSTKIVRGNFIGGDMLGNVTSYQQYRDRSLGQQTQDFGREVDDIHIATP